MSNRMSDKLAFMMATGIAMGRRDEPKPKPKTLYLAKFAMRSEAAEGGGAIPEDEIQFDFAISSAKRDGHFSYMTEKTLTNFGADAQAGVPFMLDHSEGIPNQIGRSIAGEYDETEKRATAVISMLRDTDTTPDNMKVNELIRRIERKYYDSCSVGYRGGKETCRIDGKPIWDWQRSDPCEHIPGRTYDGKLCEYDIDEGHLREVSLVPSGSNPDAKLLDRNEWDEGLRNIKKDGLAGAGEGSDPKTLLERDGLKWREQLITKALAEGVRAEDGFDETVWRERLEKNDSDTIIAQTSTWSKLGDARWGAGGRRTASGVPAGVAGGEVKALIYPSRLFEY